MSTPRPLVTDPFHPVGSIWSNMSFLYKRGKVPVISSKWYVTGCLGNVGIQQLRMCFLKTIRLRLKATIQRTLTFIR